MVKELPRMQNSASNIRSRMLAYCSLSGWCSSGVCQFTDPFNIYIDNLKNNIETNVSTCKYAEDCITNSRVKPDDISNMQSVLESVCAWADDNKMAINSTKTKDMWINSRQTSAPPPLQSGSTSIERVNHFKLLGVWFQDDLKWKTHVENITTKKYSKQIFYLRECRRARLPKEVGLSIHTTLIRPIVEYGEPDGEEFLHT